MEYRGAYRKPCETCKMKLLAETVNNSQSLTVFTKTTVLGKCLYVIIISRKSLSMKLHSIFCLNVKELLAQSRRHI